MFLGFALNLLGVAFDECSFIIFYKLFRPRNYTLHQPVPIKNLLGLLISVPQLGLRPVAFHWNKARKKEIVCRYCKK
ncbi:MAG TPA: hypothetical protein VJ225_04075, partial [Nitrososphaeraceae archaeon]|nr:hypothetical protein [Nitrososphaeraceae archaeon]